MKGARWRNDPNVTVSVVDHDDDWRYLIVRGRVTDIHPDTDLEFIDKMSTQTNFLETFNTVIEDCNILFTPQPAFFEATTLWAEALQNIYGGTGAKETLDALVEEIKSTVD